ncbi:hypothetical protein H0H81_009355 [Sphagnurus paluster]|uniref:UspA domain-containing protein n=1 Tax=Sphagnurus paluster TaxID=117069 RepID=A0A9P7KG94_9AGAR|nr:hypothetical protein H0H81_009355 [Sphagnurus paluster]
MSNDTLLKKRSWTSKYIHRPSGSISPVTRPPSIGKSTLPTTEEGKQLHTPSPSLPSSPIASSVSLPLTAASRSATFDSLLSLTGPPKRRSSVLNSSIQAQDYEATQVNQNGLERTASAQQSASLKPPEHRTSTGSFSKSFSSMMGGLSSLSLSRTSTRESTVPVNGDDKEARGRTLAQIHKRGKSSSVAPADKETSRSRSRARSTSPFSFRRFRQRDRETSPPAEAIPLGYSDVDLSDSASSVRPRTTAFSYDSGDETVGDETEDEDWSEDDFFDPITERNTEHNAIIAPVPTDGGLTAAIEAEAEVDPDPLGEGVNVVVPPEPYFPSTLNSSSRTKRNPRRRKSTKHHETLAYETSRPVFQRDRCTITITQGDPVGKLGERRKRRYVVASDLSEESRYAVEWAIGTVLRDGDELLIVTVTENESKVDPPIPNSADRTTKLRSQQERQGLAYILLRQATSLLQRTRLNVKVACQAWHAKSARHIVDYNEPTMLIVGSRGLGQLKGILLGSTSHYLIQKCSVPVMVARRRLKRPPKRSAHLSTHRTHVSLAEAGIDKVASKVDEDVQVMRDEIKRDDDRRDGGPGSRRDSGGPAIEEEEDGDEDDDGEADELSNAKVAGR